MTDDSRLADERPARGRSALRALWDGVREVLIVVGLALVLSLVVKTFLVQAFYIPSGSMEDTLVRDDRVIVSKLTPGPFDLERGDVVVFGDPDHWLVSTPHPERTGVAGVVNRALTFVGLLPDDSNDHLIKRVIGLPGDEVTCCDLSGRVQVNGVAITEPYVKAGDTPNGGRQPFAITVPEGRVWVMGDHRSDSSDSRFHDDDVDASGQRVSSGGQLGSVPIDDITGRAVAVVWPLGHATWLSVPAEVYAEVPAPVVGSP